MTSALPEVRAFNSYREAELAVIQWAEARGIIPHARPETQLLKAVSELGELCDAEAKGDAAARADAVGDVLVCLINYCALRDLDMVRCLVGAYNEIKHRRGRLTPEGLFIKEEPPAASPAQNAASTPPDR